MTGWTVIARAPNKRLGRPRRDVREEPTVPRPVRTDCGASQTRSVSWLTGDRVRREVHIDDLNIRHAGMELVQVGPPLREPDRDGARHVPRYELWLMRRRSIRDGDDPPVRRAGAIAQEEDAAPIRRPRGRAVVRRTAGDQLCDASVDRQAEYVTGCRVAGGTIECDVPAVAGEADGSRDVLRESRDHARGSARCRHERHERTGVALQQKTENL